MELAAGALGVVLGLLVAPVADRIATNAPVHAGLLRRVPRSRRLPFVAVATAALGGACGLVFGFTAEAAIAALFCSILVVVTRTDVEHRLIPDRVVLPGAVVLLAARTAADPTVEWAVAAVAAGVGMFLLVFAYPRGMGLGDVKLAALLGAALGLDVLVALFIGFFAAFAPAAVLVIRHGRDAGKSAIPLGPFLALGGVVALFAGDAILDWYRDLGSN